MSQAEKDANSSYRELDGFLRVLGYEAAWKEWWTKATEAQKHSILDIKYFNAEIFKDITGIDAQAVAPSLVGKEVSVSMDGKSYTAKIISER
jgi:hypothetical protein